MIKIGKYRICFGSWVQTEVPIVVKHFWIFWLIRKVRLTDTDKVKQFPLGTKLEHNGRTYRYYKIIGSK